MDAKKDKKHGFKVEFRGDLRANLRNQLGMRN